jgi:type IV secretory pathway VirB2 component (pilin)
MAHRKHLTISCAALMLSTLPTAASAARLGAVPFETFLRSTIDFLTGTIGPLVIILGVIVGAICWILGAAPKATSWISTRRFHGARCARRRTEEPDEDGGGYWIRRRRDDHVRSRGITRFRRRTRTQRSSKNTLADSRCSKPCYMPRRALRSGDRGRPTLLG